MSATVALHHRLDGPEDGEVLVLSNSLGTDLRMWDPQIPALAERYRVLRYDHRGHGRSPVPAGPYAIEDLGSDVLALLDALGVSVAHVCGLSIGGLVGMWLAAHAPERSSGWCCVARSPWFGPPDPWFERAAAVRAGGTGSVADRVVERWFTPAFAAREPERGRGDARHARRHACRGLRGLLRGRRHDRPPPGAARDPRADARGGGRRRRRRAARARRDAGGRDRPERASPGSPTRRTWRTSSSPPR